MNAKRLVIVSAALAAAAGGAVGAVAATHKDDGKSAEQSILTDAAKRLNVSPDALHDALAAAEDAQLDQAVKDGRLTQKQADEIKAHHKREGRVLGGPPFGHGMRGPHFFGRALGPPGEMLGDVAKALGTSRTDLLKQLRSGKSISALAKAKGKSLDDVEKAVKAAIAKRLDADVKAGRLTDRQRDEMLAHLEIRLEHLGERGLRHVGPPPKMGRGHRFRGGPPPFPPGAPPPAPESGSAPGAPPPAPPPV